MSPNDTAQSTNIIDTTQLIENIKKSIDSISQVNNLASEVNTTLPAVLEDINKKLEELSNYKETLENNKNAIKKALEGQKDENVLQNSTEEVSDLIKSYLALKANSDKAFSQISSSTEDLKKIKQYIEEFGLKEQEPPSVSKEYSEIIKPLSQSLKRIEENAHVNLYKNISDALTNGNSDKLPSDLLNLIQHLVIDRLEEIVKPYEELSKDYVSGKITQKQFTDFISKNAFLSVLRERLIADITREIENNNLSSSVIPPKLREAAENLRRSSNIIQNSGSNTTEQSISNTFIMEDDSSKPTPENNEESVSPSYSFE